MKNKICVVLVFTVVFFSCRMKMAGTNDVDLHVDNVRIDRFEILDSLMLDSLLQKSRFEHKKMTGCNANYFEFNQSQETKEYDIISCSTFLKGREKEELSLVFGYTYFNNSIVFISKRFNPIKLFKATENSDYIFIFTGGSDECMCTFDSTFKFERSVNLHTEIE